MKFKTIFLLLTITVTITAQRTKKPELHGKHWMAITGKSLGASAGAVIFQQGGNAVDAACAMLGATCTLWDVLSWGGETQALISLSKPVSQRTKNSCCNFYYGDPYVHPDIPIKGLLSKEYSRKRASEMWLDNNNPSVGPGDPYPFERRKNPFMKILKERGFDRTSGPVNAIYFDQKNRTMRGGSSNYGENYRIVW